MDLLLNAIWFFVFAAAIRYIPFFKNIRGIPYSVLLAFFLIKVLAGTILILIYTYYYTNTELADVYKYFNDGIILHSSVYQSPFDYLRMLTGFQSKMPHLETYYQQMLYWDRPWESEFYNDSRLVIRFNALVLLFSGGSIFVHNVFINFLSFSGITALYKFFSKYGTASKDGWLALGLFLFPGLLFWGSGLLKEGLLIWALGVWVYTLDRVVARSGVGLVTLLSFIVYSFILILLKPYAVVVLLPFLTAFYISGKGNPIKINLVHFTVLNSFLLLAMAVAFVYPELNLLKILVRKQNDFINHSLEFEAQSLIHTNYLTYNFGDIVLAYLKGIYHGFTRPNFFDSLSPVVLMAALENFFIWLMMLYVLLRYDKKRIVDYPIKWAGIWYAIILTGLVGMLSVAYGGIVRYRIPALPFLWMFFVYSVQLPEFRFSNLKWRGIPFLRIKIKHGADEK